MRRAIALLLLTFPLRAVAESPAQALAAAHRDCLSRPPAERPYLRYLSLYATPAGDLEAHWRALDFHVNQLSREPEIVSPSRVRRVSPSLAAVHLLDYRWTAEVWDKLADADPYFHVRLEQTVELAGEVWRDRYGRLYREPPRRERKRITAAAPWLDAAQTAELIALTHSPAPIVRGDWFLWQTAAQADRTPGYYDFLGVTDERSFERLVGFNREVLRDFPKVHREAVAVSTVTLQPRRIDRGGTVGGGYWFTSDSRVAVDRHNPLRVLNGELQYDAREAFGFLPNGLLAWLVAKADGKRQDFAPPEIAADATAPGPDRRVHVGVSCVRCHPTGINDIDGWARNLFQAPVVLAAADPERLRELRRLYLSRLEPVIRQDRQQFAEAIREANGLTPSENAANYGRVFAGYDLASVDLARAARELGDVTPERLAQVLTEGLKGVPFAQVAQTDLVAAGLLRGRGIPIRQWHELYPLLQQQLKGAGP